MVPPDTEPSSDDESSDAFTLDERRYRSRAQPTSDGKREGADNDCSTGRGQVRTRSLDERDEPGPSNRGHSERIIHRDKLLIRSDSSSEEDIPLVELQCRLRKRARDDSSNSDQESAMHSHNSNDDSNNTVLYSYSEGERCKEDEMINDEDGEAVRVGNVKDTNVKTLGASNSRGRKERKFKHTSIQPPHNECTVADGNAAVTGPLNGRTQRNAVFRKLVADLDEYLTASDSEHIRTLLGTQTLVPHSAMPKEQVGVMNIFSMFLAPPVVVTLAVNVEGQK